LKEQLADLLMISWLMAGTFWAWFWIIKLVKMVMGLFA